MQILEVTWRHRNDFGAIMKCEHCEAKCDIVGYRDANYYCNVIPAMACSRCGKTQADPVVAAKGEPGVARQVTL